MLYTFFIKHFSIRLSRSGFLEERIISNIWREEGSTEKGNPHGKRSWLISQPLEVIVNPLAGLKA
jgi:hypothetical protein